MGKTFKKGSQVSGVDTPRLPLKNSISLKFFTGILDQLDDVLLNIQDEFTLD